MTKAKTGTVYRLVDPSDNKIRYIGKTTQPILNRLAGHLAQPTNPAMRVWINSLSLQGLTPRIETISTTATANLDVEEQRQIRHHAKAGHRLLNAPYYQNHVADLSGVHRGRSEVRHESEQRGTPEQRLARRFFGELAQARADGRVRPWAVFCFVVLSSPVYCSLLILWGLLRIRLIRASLFVLMWAWPFWESGFDRAVHDLVLVHLPLEEWSTLWTMYGAGPLNTLARDMLWPMVIAFVIQGAAAYSEVASPHHVPPNVGA
ncbi:MAG TPA: hypothetical protein VI172_01635 [Candidatus Dormibacteraeota bacterium]|jgi:hypothetical protein